MVLAQRCFPALQPFPIGFFFAECPAGIESLFRIGSPGSTEYYPIAFLDSQHSSSLAFPDFLAPPVNDCIFPRANSVLVAMLNTFLFFYVFSLSLDQL